jgi:hypothetical protein
MKIKYTQLALIFFTLLVYSACKKNKPAPIIEDPRNHSLLKKSIDEIRVEISGKWQVQYSYSYGAVGIQKYTPPLGQGNLFFFLANDTVKQSSFDLSLIFLYDKANIVKTSINAYNGEPVYTYNFSNPLNRPLIMQEIKNDTLIVDAGFASGGGFNYYLMRKQ